ncbi:hypothetical protein pdam_00014098 [Pocillopora damicornis]|uniref:Uncharacterized protein n=1 Tax=Pocillopora damicornis TaxID=46731 RepID=A0A3M6ULY7_POCDA|nr:hypothetical protein pdam_00014098 [Pocillopora damicornis]
MATKVEMYSATHESVTVGRDRKILTGSNDIIVQFANCDASPNSLFALFPNHHHQLPYGHGKTSVFDIFPDCPFTDLSSRSRKGAIWHLGICGETGRSERVS